MLVLAKGGARVVTLTNRAYEQLQVLLTTALPSSTPGSVVQPAPEW